jgi:lipopolysaccharide export system protein LptC
MSWRTGVTLLLLAAALVFGWLAWTQRDGAGAGAAGAARPDYLLEDFELVALNKQGQQAFTLRAPRLARDPAQRTMDIATPLFLIPPKSGAAGDPWEVRAKTGWVSAEGDELRLRGDVEAKSANPVDAVTLTGQELNVFPDARRATSSAPVTITRPGSILNGRTLEVQLDSKQYALTEVRHRYVPRR